MSKTITSLLAQDIHSVLDADAGTPRQVVLWVDEESQFSRLIAGVTQELETLGVSLLDSRSYDGQFALKVAVTRLELDHSRVVVYLPGHGRDDLRARPDGQTPALWGVIEYRYKGAVWGTANVVGDLPGPMTLDRWLERHGASFSGGSARKSLLNGGADSPLARLVSRMARQDIDALPSPLNLRTVDAALAGDPRDRVIDLIIDPAGALERWGDEASEVADSLGETFGLTAGEEADEWSDVVCVQMALLETWDTFDQPPDFPFAARLPTEGEGRDNALRLLRDHLLTRPDVTARIRSVAAHHDPEFKSLRVWAADKRGMPTLIASLAAYRTEALLKSISKALASGPAAAAKTLADGVQDSGTDLDEPARLVALRQASELARLIDAEKSRISDCSTATEAIRRQSESWWKIDARYLAIAATCREDPKLAPVATLTGRLYVDFIAATNQRFSDLVEADPAWPPSDSRSVREAASETWQTGTRKSGRRAVLILDALRFDVAKDVEARVGTSASTNAVVSTLPTTTPFGMTALLPLAQDAIDVAMKSGKLSLAAEGLKKLEQRGGRKDLLSEKVGHGKAARLAFLELEDIISGATLPAARVIVAFDYALDDKGHSPDAAGLPELVPRYAARVARAIERLHDDGVARVDVLTDHGFLFAPADLIDALGHPMLPPQQADSKQPRYAILAEGAAATQVARRPVPLCPSVELGFPRGIRTLMKASPYLHGGISLQECVIPHLVSTRAASTARLRAEISVAATKVSGATIPFGIKPVREDPDGQLSLEGPRPIRVRFTVTAGAKEVVEPVTLDVRADSPEQRSAVYLRDGVSLKAGTSLILRAEDADSGENLFEQQLTLEVDWE